MKIEYSSRPSAIEFTVRGGGQNIPVDLWQTRTEESVATGFEGIHTLMKLVSCEEAKLTDSSVIVPQEVIAKLSYEEVIGLGLPTMAPYTLELTGRGLLTDPDFCFEYRFINYFGRPIVSWERSGTVLQVENRQYTLLDPLFTLVAAVDDFNTHSPVATDDHFRAWGRIRRLLPKDVSTDGYLRDLRVADVRSFSLDVFADDQGMPNARVIPVFRKPRATGNELVEAADPDEPNDFERILPPKFEVDFHQQFITRGKVQSGYSLGEWYVFLSPNVRNGLVAAHNALRGSVEQRSAFLKNPYGAVRQELPTGIPEEELEEVFCEPTDYGSRVAEIGKWQPKLLPFLKQAKEPWLPPEELGILIDGAPLHIATQDLAELKVEVRQAIESGKDCIEYQGTLLPATKETLNALSQLVELVKPDSDAEKTTSQQSSERTNVLLLGDRDNLESLGYLVKTRPRQSLNLDVPGNLKSTLKPHQMNGLRWLQAHWTCGSQGALLADDMGLGKTLLCLTFLAWLRTNTRGISEGISPSLVIAPTSLVENWVDEHRIHFTPPGIGSLFVARGTGLGSVMSRNSETRGELSTGESSLNLRALSAHALVLSTYETVRDYSHSFGKVKWQVVVLDEAQKIKNPAALTAEQCKAVASNAEFVIALTGTPVENRMSDLWSILDVCQPGLLKDLRSFCRTYEADTGDSRKALRELHQQICQDQNLVDSVPQDVKPVLRRMKVDHIEGLPSKDVRLIRTEMPKPQADAYSLAIMGAKGAEKRKGYMLEALHRLRSVSLHPFRYPESFGSGARDRNYIAASARLRVTFDVLDEINEIGERALIFLESRDLQPILQGLIQRRYELRRPPIVINGKVAGAVRKKRVDEFQKGRGFGVIILSPRAAGVGLTLTSANHVIHLSRWWNPAVEDQCTDRVYRIGQTQNVHVYLPLAVHPQYGDASFDVRLEALLASKRELNHLVMAPSAATNKDFERFYSETVDEASAGAVRNGELEELLRSMDGEQFENWVLDCLRRRGFEVARTPRTHDKGADATAVLKDGNAPVALLIQCKQTQGDALCAAAAVEEILNAQSQYEDPGITWTPIVVTNASGFSRDAIALARNGGVRLFDLTQLQELDDPTGSLDWSKVATN